MASTKQRMITTTAGLVRAQGLHATGLNQVLADARAPKGSMYHHFPGGKEELVVHAIAEYGEVVRTLLVHCMDGNSVEGGIEAFIVALGNQMSRSGYHAGCPVGVTAMEAGASSDALGAATKAVFEMWTDVLVRRLEDAGEEPTRAQDLATTAVAAIEGAVMLTRSSRSTAPLAAVARTLQRLLGPGSLRRIG